MRYYSSTAGEMTLTAGISAGDSSVQLDTVVGLPVSYPFTLFLDYGGASEEIVDVTSGSGTTLTISRGVDGTSAQAHSLGAKVRHGMSGRDLRESQQHIAATAAHGVAGNVVGTTDAQTLTNKTLAGPVLTGTTEADAVTADSLTVNPGTAAGIVVKQALAPAAAALDTYEDEPLASVKARVKLAPGATNIFEATGNNYGYVTGGSVVMTKDGRVTITGSNGVASPSDPVLALVNSNPSGGKSLSVKNSAGTEVASVDKDGNLTSPTITSLDGRLDTLEGQTLDARLDTIESNLGSQTTFVASSAAKDGKRIHWGVYAIGATGGDSVTVTHGAGFTPTVVVPSCSVPGLIVSVESFTATTFTIKARVHDGTNYGSAFTLYAFLGE